MNRNIDLNNMSTDEIKEWLINIKEKYYYELKKASELPNAFWETYSSFCNTAGGFIILGVAENRPFNEITGVSNSEKALLSLWDQLSNPNKVSFRNVDNQDVHTYNIDGKNIIIVYVKEVPDSMKPVYIGGKLENSWIRTGDGDRKATKEELATFMRNAQPCQDALPAEQFTIDDLDLDSVITYKERVSKRFPKKKYIEMQPLDFLLEIGAAFKERGTNQIKLRRGTILFLGKCNSIKELYPHYHLDYFNRRGNNPRWSDRVSDDEPSDYEMNIYNFYNIVYEKIKTLLKESFSLDNTQLRVPLSDFDETIRECLVNSLAHADYVQGYPSTKIEVHDGWFYFANPGKMLVSKEQFVTGGDSRPRNDIIMKLFRLLGASERQGFGGPLIFKTALSNDLRRPEINTNLERTELKIWNIDLADSYPDLSEDEKNVFRYIVKNGSASSVNSIKNALSLSEYKVRKLIQSLEEKGRIQKIGNGSSTKYMLAYEKTELLTQLQMALDILKTHLV